MDSRVSFSCVWSGANENYSSKLMLLFLDRRLCVCQIYRYMFFSMAGVEIMMAFRFVVMQFFPSSFRRCGEC